MEQERVSRLLAEGKIGKYFVNCSQLEDRLKSNSTICDLYELKRDWREGMERIGIYIPVPCERPYYNRNDLDHIRITRDLFDRFKTKAEESDADVVVIEKKDFDCYLVRR